MILLINNDRNTNDLMVINRGIEPKLMNIKLKMSLEFK